MKRGVVLMMATAMVLGMTACGGGEVSSEGRIGDTMETYFFDFTIDRPPGMRTGRPLRGICCWWRR